MKLYMIIYFLRMCDTILMASDKATAQWVAFHLKFSQFYEMLKQQIIAFAQAVEGKPDNLSAV